MRAALRRVRRVEAPTAIVTDDFTIDIAAWSAFHSDGSEIHLTGVEFEWSRFSFATRVTLSRASRFLKRSGARGAPTIPATHACSSSGSAKSLNPIPPIPATCTQPPV